MTQMTAPRLAARLFGGQRVNLSRLRKAIALWMRGADRHAYTMVEILCVITLLTVLMNATLLFIFDGRRRCRDAIAQIDIHQRSMLLRKPWRDFIASLPPTLAIDADGVLRAGEYHAQQKENRLLLAGADGLREYDIPSGIDLQFHLEDGLDGTQCAVLVVQAKAQDRQRRIVACLSSGTHGRSVWVPAGHDNHMTRPMKTENR